MYKSLNDVKRVVELGKNVAVVEQFTTSYIKGEAYRVWNEVKEAEHKALFPKLVDGEPILDENGSATGEFTQIPNPDYIEFNEWMKETTVTQPAVEATLDADGNVLTEAVAEVTALVREFTEPDVTALEVSTFMNDRGFYKQAARSRIEKEVGDDKDLLADISKRLALNERLLMRLTHELLPTLAADGYVAQAYGGMIAQYLAGVDGGVIKDRADYEDTAILFSDLIVKTNKIGEIVNDEYLSKKV
jgi:hypothetical protein